MADIETLLRGKLARFGAFNRRPLKAVLLFATLAFTVHAQAQDEVHFYLIKGAVYADSKEHFKDAMQMLGEKDYEAMAKMAMQGSLSGPTTKKTEISFTNGVPVFSSEVEFRFKGDSNKYWTDRKVVQTSEDAVKDPSPTPEPATDVQRVINNLANTYGNQYGDKVATKLADIKWSANEVGQEKYPRSKKSAAAYTKRVYDGVLTNLVTEGFLKRGEVKDVEASTD